MYSAVLNEFVEPPSGAMIMPTPHPLRPPQVTLRASGTTVVVPIAVFGGRFVSAATPDLLRVVNSAATAMPVVPHTSPSPYTPKTALPAVVTFPKPITPIGSELVFGA